MSPLNTGVARSILLSTKPKPNPTPIINKDPLVLWLQMEGIDGSESFIDSSSYNNTMISGGTEYSTISSAKKKSGNSSVFFNRSKVYSGPLRTNLSELFDIKKSPFRVELSWYPDPDGGSVNQLLISFGKSVVGYDLAPPLFNIYSGGLFYSNTSIIFHVYNNTGDAIIWDYYANNIFIANSWNDIVVVGDGNQIKLYVNNSILTTCDQPNWISKNRIVELGPRTGSLLTTYGYIDDVKIFNYDRLNK